LKKEQIVGSASVGQGRHGGGACRSKGKPVGNGKLQACSEQPGTIQAFTTNILEQQPFTTNIYNIRS
jgi:hypothetical protein